MRGWVSLSPHKSQAEIHRLNRSLTVLVSKLDGMSFAIFEIPYCICPINVLQYLHGDIEFVINRKANASTIVFTLWVIVVGSPAGVSADCIIETPQGNFQAITLSGTPFNQCQHCAGGLSCCVVGSYFSFSKEVMTIDYIECPL